MVPSVMVEMDKEDFLKCMVEFSMEHRDDLPSPDTIQQEFSSWYHKYSEKEKSNKKKKSSVPDSLLEAYKDAEGSVNYPNTLYLLKLLLTIPATSASTERANSTLKFIKTRLRSRISQKSLNTFVLGYKHKDILHSLDSDSLLQAFIGMKRRRLLLLNPLSE